MKRTIYLRKTLFAIAMMAGSLCVYGQPYTETFTNATGLAGNSAYNDGSFVGVDGINWEWVSCQDGDKQATKYVIDGVTPVLRHPSAYIQTKSAISGGIASFSLDYKRAYTSATADRIVEVYINGELKGSGENCKGDATERTMTIEDINVAGNFTVKIKIQGDGTTNAQTCIDNFTWTPYASTEPIFTAFPDDLSFGSVLIGHSGNQSVLITGLNLDGSISYITEGSDASAFEVEPDAGWTDSEGGTLNIIFTPELERDYSAKLVVKTDGEEDLEINLFGTGTTNLALNGGFEIWTNDHKPESWFGVRTNLTQARVNKSEDSHSGNFACELTYPTGSGGSRFTTESCAVVDGETYTFSFWAKGNASTIRTGIYDGRSGSGYSSYVSLDIIGSEWELYTQEIKAENTTENAEFIFYLPATGTEDGIYMLIDDVSIKEGSRVAIKTANASDIAVYANNNTIFVSGIDKANIAVYDLTGQLIRQTTSTAIPVATKGIFIVKVNGQAFKILNK